jgi:transcriptional regulator with XRE-family HTH domain
MESVNQAYLKNGQILTGFRKQNKMTQAELGKIIGRDSRDISKYETGLRPIPQAAVDYLNSTYKLKLKSTGKVVKVIKTTKNHVIEFTKPSKSTKASVTFELPSVTLKKTPKKAKRTSKAVKTTKTAKTVKPSKVEKTVKSTKKTTPVKAVKTETTTKTTTTKTSTFGKRLSSFRTGTGLGVKAFAKKYKLTVSGLTRLESGSALTVSITALRALSKDVSIDALVR